MIVAEFPGTCPKCDQKFPVGTYLTSGEDGWGHAQCPTPVDALTPRNPVCTECWLDHPPGACDR